MTSKGSILPRLPNSNMRFSLLARSSTSLTLMSSMKGPDSSRKLGINSNPKRGYFEWVPHYSKKRWSWFIKILSALRIEACWPSCVVFSFSLFFPVYSTLSCDIVDITVHTAPTQHKIPSFPCSLQPQIKPFLLFKTLNPTYFYQIAIKSLFNLNTTPKLFFQQYVSIDLQILLTPQLPHIDKFFYVNKFC